jgi:hypothetical protein
MGTIIAHPDSEEQNIAVRAVLKALKVKFEVKNEKKYNEEFVAKVLESKKQAAAGKATRVAKKDLQKFLGL